MCASSGVQIYQFHAFIAAYILQNGLRLMSSDLANRILFLEYNATITVAGNSFWAYCYHDQRDDPQHAQVNMSFYRPTFRWRLGGQYFLSCHHYHSGRLLSTTISAHD